MQKKENKVYFISRIINNNVITSIDSGKEIVLMGKGISFNKRINDAVDNKQIEKLFILSGKEKSRFFELIDSIPTNFLEIATKIVETFERELECKINTMAYILLADHIYGAIDRKNDNIVIKNELLNEIKRYYSKEFEIGLKALTLIEEETMVRLDIDEAGFITLHIINSTGKDMSNFGMKRIELIDRIIAIIESYFSIKLNQNTLCYDRFLIHLKYFTFRVFKEEVTDDNDNFFYKIGKIQYPEIRKCVELIEEYIKYNHNISITDEEKGYLLIHIRNLLNKK